MRTYKLYTPTLLALALTVFSCDKDEEPEVLEAVATLAWSGPYAADGCGYSVQIKEKVYKPQNERGIDSRFERHEPATVEIKYTLPTEMLESYCGRGKIKSESIRLLSIKEL